MKAPFNGCHWSTNERILRSIRYGYRIPGVGRVMATRLLAINRDGTKHLPLDARTRNLVGQPQQLTPQIRDRVVSQLPDDDRGIPVRLNRMHADRPWMSRLDIHDYRLTRVRRFRAQIRR